MIRNKLLGGNDFGNEVLRFGNLNDTFDEIVRIIDNGNQ